MQKQPPEMFYKKAVIKNLTIFTGKGLCWNFFLIQNIVKFLRTPILKNLRIAASENLFMKLRKIKNCSASISETSENDCFCFMIGSLEFVFTYNIFLMW